MTLRILTLALALILAAAASAQQPPEASLVPAQLLARAKSWAYQLQHPAPSEIAASSFDVIVIDYSRNGTDEKRFKPVDVKWMKRRAGGGTRLVLAYMSLGEAEDYRFYWDEKWIETATPDDPAATDGAIPPARGAQGPQAAAGAPQQGAPPATSASGRGPASAKAPTTGVAPAAAAAGAEPPAQAKPDRWLSAQAPPWLGDENERWGGNFEVKYWEKGWQDIIFGTPRSYLERIVAAGFDGVYLDRVDAFYQFQDERGTAADEMVDFVERLAAHARKLKPGFLVVPQNGEELLLKPRFLAAIDGIAKEDLFFGGPGNGQPNHPAVVANSLSWLSQADQRKLPVLVIEYLDRPEQMAEARRLIEARGYVPYFGVRDLDKLVPQPERAAPPAAQEPARPAVAAPQARKATKAAAKATDSKGAAKAKAPAAAKKQQAP